MNAPYLWGGAPFFGDVIVPDLLKIVIISCGYKLLRDASRAVKTRGIKFIEESEPGTLAFF
jgi:hypothetical protein